MTLNHLRRLIGRVPVIRRTFFFMTRLRTASYHLLSQFVVLVRWLARSRETTNFTYDLDENNKQNLASLIADVLDQQPAIIEHYLNEIETDAKLKHHVFRMTKSSIQSHVADTQARFGRRIGWYAFVRALKPRVVVETGVDKGLGALVITAALMKNSEEGHVGHYYGTDLNPTAGYLLAGDYARFGHILYGDSLESLEKLDCLVDLFINDSDHSAEYESAEYAAISSKLSDHAILLGDNAHCTDRLRIFSIENGRRFLYFHERPTEHWYPGAGIGISFKRSASPMSIEPPICGS